jgi:ATP-dependent Lon protease
MSDDSNDTDVSAEADVASTGAAADSAEYNASLRALPRVLRYAILVNKDEAFAVERLFAEIAELAPGRPLTIAWARDRALHGRELANDLDHLAVVLDMPDLRGLSDAVRLLSLPVPSTETDGADHIRVSKALLHAYHQLPENTDHELAAEIESFSVGWALLPVAANLLSRYRSSGASDNARRLGQSVSRHSVELAEETLRKRYRKDSEKLRQAAEEANDAGIDSPAKDGLAYVDHLVVCRIDEATVTNPKMKELIAPFKNAINIAMPLILVPKLHDVREKLRFEFPYAHGVIDFALADLIGRRTVRLRPLLMVGDAGGGKSRFARRLGEVLGVGVWRTDASRSDGAVFGGTDKRWYSAEPAHPFLAIAQAKHANPMVLIDEIEKAATRTDYGRFWDCLLGFLESETAARYPDPALQANIDVSQVSYVSTANALDPLPGPLRDRFRIVTFPKPDACDLDALLPAIIADLAGESGLDSRWVEPLAGFERDAVAMHWRGGSVRRLRRVVEIVLRARDKSAARN